MIDTPASRPPPFARFGVAALAVAIACLVRLAMGPFLGSLFPFLFFFPAILVSA